MAINAIKGQQESLKLATVMRGKIRLELFRHDRKGSSLNDYEAPLTPEGQIHAFEVGAQKKPVLANMVVKASPRERTLHTAALQAFSLAHSRDSLVGLTIDEIRAKFKELGCRLAVDHRLNFYVEGNAEFRDRFYEELNRKDDNRTLDFQRLESDHEILKLASKIASIPLPERQQYKEGIMAIKGYKRMVGDMAEMVCRYVRALSLWQKTYNRNSTAYPNDEMQVFMGTHSQNLECFLMRIMEMQGENILEGFLLNLPDKKSFINFSEGVSVTIEGVVSDEIYIPHLRIRIKFRDQVWGIELEDLKTMINEKKDFDNQVLKIIEDNCK